MMKISEELKNLVEESGLIFSTIPIADWEKRKSTGKWSKKQILGHLIDSAANNHQRFVRAQYEKNPAINYDQEQWVSIQAYDNAPINNLINLWIFLNKHLAHIISNIPPENYSNLCDIKKDEPVTLDWVIKDYIKHLKHHLNQIYGQEIKV